MSESRNEERVGAELVPARPLVHPNTGEVIDVASAPTEALAGFLNAVREHEDAVKDAKRVASAEVLRRMDGDATWTVEVDGWKLSAPSPDRTTYDVDVLRRELAGLKRKGVISKAALDKAIERKVSYAVRAAGVKALKKLGGKVAEAIERAEAASTSPRYVKVTPPRPEARR